MAVRTRRKRRALVNVNGCAEVGPGAECFSGEGRLGAQPDGFLFKPDAELLLNPANDTIAQSENLPGGCASAIHQGQGVSA